MLKGYFNKMKPDGSHNNKTEFEGYVCPDCGNRIVDLKAIQINEYVISVYCNKCKSKFNAEFKKVK